MAHVCESHKRKQINSHIKEKKGWDKITRACAHAASRGWKYIWIDTCCIDKSDLSELSEAINSMFRWYQRATICYAYLADVSFLEDGAPSKMQQLFREADGLPEDGLFKSFWPQTSWNFSIVNGIQSDPGMIGAMKSNKLRKSDASTSSTSKGVA